MNEKGENIWKELVIFFMSIPLAIYRWYVIGLYYNNIIAIKIGTPAVSILLIGTISSMLVLMRGIKKQDSVEVDTDTFKLFLENVSLAVVSNVFYFIFKAIV